MSNIEIAPTGGLKGLVEIESAGALIVAAWPEAMDSFVDERIEGEVALVQSVIRQIREVRSQYNIPPKN